MDNSQEYQLDVFENKEELSNNTVNKIIEIINNSLTKKGNAKIVLSGGSTPFDVYLKLGKTNLDWSRVDVFLGDERWVESNSKSSNNLMLKKSIFSTEPGNKANYIPIPTTEYPTPAESSIAFEKLLKVRFNNIFPVFDLMLLGLGDDGHTAYLFPGTSAINENKKWVTFGLGKDQDRITMTYPLLCSSTNIIFLVSGSSKKIALKRLIDPNESFKRTPAKLIRSSSKILILADKDSVELI